MALEADFRRRKEDTSSPRVWSRLGRGRLRGTGRREARDFQKSRPCKKNSTKEYTCSISRIPLDAKDEEGRTALHLATNASVAKVLIDGGASAVAQDKACWVSPPLAKVQTHFFNAYTIKHLSVRFEMRKGGGEIHTDPQNGKTPLHNAVRLKSIPPITNEYQQCRNSFAGRIQRRNAGGPAGRPRPEGGGRRGGARDEGREGQDGAQLRRQEGGPAGGEGPCGKGRDVLQTEGKFDVCQKYCANRERSWTKLLPPWPPWPRESGRRSWRSTLGRGSRHRRSRKRYQN